MYKWTRSGQTHVVQTINCICKFSWKISIFRDEKTDMLYLEILEYLQTLQGNVNRQSYRTVAQRSPSRDHQCLSLLITVSFLWMCSIRIFKLKNLELLFPSYRMSTEKLVHGKM